MAARRMNNGSVKAAAAISMAKYQRKLIGGGIGSIGRKSEETHRGGGIRHGVAASGDGIGGKRDILRFVNL